MHAYVDETGNTGAKLLDENQPLFITAALMTRSDFDARFGDEVRAIAQSIGVEEIHANRLGLGRIEGIAAPILRVLRKAGPAFAVSRVEKRYVLASKIFDTLFDPFDNKAVPWQVYNIRPLRLALVFKVAYLLDDELASSFWDVLMEVNAERAKAGLVRFCQAFIKRVGHLPDERSRELIGEAIAWASDNPESFTLVSESRQMRSTHLPNMVGFGNLLDGIERQSISWGYPVKIIRHDRQSEFEQGIRLWHKLFSNARPDVIDLPLGERVVLRKVFGSRLEISSAKESPGIQVVDIILWLLSRAFKGDELPQGCQKLMDYVYARARQDDFSFAGVGAATEQVIEQIFAADISDDTLARAAALRKQGDEQRREAMLEYARAKVKRADREASPDPASS